jgi:hypothetical protein
VRDQGLAGGGHADAEVTGDHRNGRAAGFGRQGGQDGRCRAVVGRRGKTGAGTASVAVSAALRAASGGLVRAMVVTPFPILRSDSRFHLPALVFSGRQMLWSARGVKRLRDNSSCRF